MTLCVYVICGLTVLATRPAASGDRKRHTAFVHFVGGSLARERTEQYEDLYSLHLRVYSSWNAKSGR